MRALISSSCSIALLLHRSRGATRVSVACFRRVQYSTASSECSDETISIPVGGSGSISLQITRPSKSSRSNQGHSPGGPNVILYVPPGPLFQDTGTISSEHDGISDPKLDHHKRSELDYYNLAYTASPQHVLASTTSAVVVTVNYRLGDIKTEKNTTSSTTLPSAKLPLSKDPIQPLTFYKYPTPVHDTLSAFDWIQSNLNPSRLAIFGTHIGASLALMLSLTEHRSIEAVAAIEPICDWPSLDDYCTRETETESSVPEQKQEQEQETSHNPSTPKHKRQPRKKTAPPDLVPLLHAREQFFSKPERYFDAFASPILFLRSAGRDVPRSFPEYLTGPGYPVPVLKDSTRGSATDLHEMFSISDLDADIYSDVDVNAEETRIGDEGGGTVPRRRKALSRWPPYGLDYGLSGDSRSRARGGVEIRRLEAKLPLVNIWVRDGLDGVGGVKRKGRVGGKELVLGRQADEMVSVMRRACFWGREKGVGERRVGLERVGGLRVAEEEVGEWLGRVFRGNMDDLD
ncbi:Alpha/beta hydrolase fold-3 [Penicillium sp. DV-2018c]|nr:Alpha/beta hydrolase fold-3 [Penicillium sp. DV-2018c]